jgi:2-hydroxychromene-2-carboxylate isomerase
MWSDPKKLDDLDVFERALIDSGLPANEILAAIEDPDVKARLISNTESSVARGVFGSPSFFVGEELFFGKDKLREVEEEIVSQQAALEG